jgi:hypothetical protein
MTSISYTKINNDLLLGILPIPCSNTAATVLSPLLSFTLLSSLISILLLPTAAGTHDLPLAYETLDQLTARRDEASPVALPRYDKSKREGRGDRADVGSWPIVSAPVNIILLEGWMLGFIPTPPLSDTAQSSASAHLEASELFSPYVTCLPSLGCQWLPVLLPSAASLSASLDRLGS